MKKLAPFYIVALYTLTACNNSSEKTREETLHVDGDSVKVTTTDKKNSPEADYQLEDLSPKMTNHIEQKLKEAETLIIKYNGKLPPSKYDAEVLDDVFTKWRLDTKPGKETTEYVVEAIGAALGQDIVNSLDCEWKVLTDLRGTDLTVIHKKYKINSFPFSTAEKAFLDIETGTFNGTKLAMKKNIQDAEKTGAVAERK